MKRLILANSLLVMLLFLVSCLIKHDLDIKAAAAPAKIYIKQINGTVIKYTGQKIEPIVKTQLTATEAKPTVTKVEAKPVLPQAEPKKLPSIFKIDTANKENFRQQVLQQYELYRFYGTGPRNLSRIKKYSSFISQASHFVGYEAEIATGLIAIESMGLPNEVSSEDARGLMQILSVPKSCWEQTQKILHTTQLDLHNPRHNIFLGLVTLRHYTRKKDNDLLRGLVAYNFGPNRQSLMQADNFADFAVSQSNKEIKIYPFKVLAMVLMDKVQAKYGRALPYELGCEKIEVQDKKTSCQAKEKKYRLALSSIPLPGIDY